VGWPVAANTRTAVVLDALWMAWRARDIRLEGLVAHFADGSRHTSVHCDEHVAELVAVPSIGTVGGQLACVGAARIKAPSESFCATLKKELVQRITFPPAPRSASRSVTGSNPGTSADASAPSSAVHPRSDERTIAAEPPLRPYNESVWPDGGVPSGGMVRLGFRNLGAAWRTFTGLDTSRLDHDVDVAFRYGHRVAGPTRWLQRMEAGHDGLKHIACDRVGALIDGSRARNP